METVILNQYPTALPRPSLLPSSLPMLPSAPFTLGLPDYSGENTGLPIVLSLSIQILIALGARCLPEEVLSVSGSTSKSPNLSSLPFGQSVSVSFASLRVDDSYTCEHMFTLARALPKRIQTGTNTSPGSETTRKGIASQFFPRALRHFGALSGKLRTHCNRITARTFP